MSLYPISRDLTCSSPANPVFYITYKTFNEITAVFIYCLLHARPGTKCLISLILPETYRDSLLHITGKEPQGLRDRLLHVHLAGAEPQFTWRQAEAGGNALPLPHVGGNDGQPTSPLL